MSRFDIYRHASNNGSLTFTADFSDDMSKFDTENLKEIFKTTDSELRVDLHPGAPGKNILRIRLSLTKPYDVSRYLNKSLYNLNEPISPSVALSSGHNCTFVECDPYGDYLCIVYEQGHEAELIERLKAVQGEIEYIMSHPRMGLFLRKHGFNEARELIEAGTEPAL